MAITNVYSDKVVGKDYRVYVVPFVSSTVTTETGTPTILEYVKTTSAASLTWLSDLLGIQTGTTPVDVFYEIGELRRDSITQSLSQGNTVEGNNVGTVVIDKSGELNFEVINLSEDVMAQFDELDRTTICVLKVYEGRLNSAGDAWVEGYEAEAEFYPDYKFNYNESLTGGEVGMLPINIKKEVESIDGYNLLLPYTS